MSADAPSDLLDVAQIDSVTVVRFTRRTILEPLAIETVGQRLLALVEVESRRRLILDFSRVESLTSGMLGKFIALHQAIESGGGRLVFCGVGPFLKQIFTICNIPGTIPLLSDEAEAVRTLAAV
jgi:anti-anti-sigma regulatory factor